MRRSKLRFDVCNCDHTLKYFLTGLCPIRGERFQAFFSERMLDRRFQGGWRHGRDICAGKSCLLDGVNATLMLSRIFNPTALFLRSRQTLVLLWEVQMSAPPHGSHAAAATRWKFFPRIPRSSLSENPRLLIAAMSCGTCAGPACLMFGVSYCCPGGQ